MKKILAFILVLIMGLSLVACGNNDTNKDNEDISGQTENQSTEQPGTDNTTSGTESQPTSEPEESTNSAFDTGWAGDEYAMPIPEPPFTKFTVNKNDYKDHVQYYVYSTDKSEISALTEKDIVDYCESLKNYGFTDITVELEYNQDNCMFRAFTEDKNLEVCVDCYIELGNIVIYVKQNIAE